MIDILIGTATLFSIPITLVAILVVCEKADGTPRAWTTRYFNKEADSV